MVMSKIDLGVALVTGASSGIGQATAQALKRAGYRVFGTSRRVVPETSDGVTMLSCDVTDDASVQKMVDEVLNKVGRIDLLVNKPAWAYSVARRSPRPARLRRCSM